MPDNPLLTFGKFIAALRDHRRVSQDKLAQAMGYKHRSMVARLESGQRSWTLEQVEQTAKFFNIKTSELLAEYEKFKAP